MPMEQEQGRKQQVGQKYGVVIATIRVLGAAKTIRPAIWPFAKSTTKLAGSQCPATFAHHPHI